MMMPANYSAVAENEVIYGGAGIADYLPKAWDASNVRTLTTNLITLVSNTFTSALVSATLGTMFGGNWGKDGIKLFGSEGTINNLFTKQRNYTTGGKFTGFADDDMSTLSKFMTVLGVASSVYTLGTTGAKVSFNKNVTGING